MGRDNVVPALQEMAGYVTANVVPAVQQMAQWVADNVVPCSSSSPTS
ncbi:MAG: hypothetical protein ACLTDR_11760 [Adlercreutzia equolifaciens]